MKKISRVLLAICLSLFMVFATGCIDMPNDTQYVSVNVVNSSEIASKGNVSWNNGNDGNVVKGSNVTIVFSALDGYAFESVLVNGTDKTADVNENNELVVAGVNEHLNLVVSFCNSYVMEFTAGVGGTISVDKSTAKEGDDVMYTITPHSSYAIDKVFDGEIDVTSQLVDGKLTLMNVTSSHNVTVSFIRTYSISVNPTNNGNVICEKMQVKEGESVRVTAVPSNGYMLETFSINGVDYTSSLVDNSIIIQNVSEDLVVNSTFRTFAYFVTIAQTQNGTVSASANEGQIGEIITLTITPNANYELSSLLINGVESKDSVVNGIYQFALNQNANVLASFDKTQYAITVQSAQNGTISANKETVKYGEEVTFSIVADDNYVLDTFVVNGVDKTLEVINGTYSTVVTSQLTVSASFRAINYTVDIAQIQNGTVTASANEGYYGDIVVLNITPSANYELASLLINGIECKDGIANGKFYYLTLTQDATVLAIFAKKQYSISIIESQNGIVTCNKEEENAGRVVVFCVNANAHYEIDTFTVNGEDKKSEIINGQYEHAVDGNVTVSATFKVIQYTVSVNDSENGSLTANKEIVTYGETVAFSVVANAHYEIDTFTVNGEDKKSEIINGRYEYIIDGNVTVSATFKAKQYTVSVNESENGSLTANKETVTYGESVMFTIVANEYYELATFIVNGEDKKSEIVNGQYEHTVDGNVMVRATFKLIEYVISIDVIENGRVSTNKETVTYGESVMFTIVANEHYELATFIVNGEDKKSEIVEGQYSYVVDGNVTIYATFTKKVYTISVSSNEFGSVQIHKLLREEGDEEYEGELSVTFDEEIEVITYANAYCSLISLKLCGEEIAVNENGECVIKITQDSTLCAVFEEDVYQITKNKDNNGTVELSATTAKGEEKVIVTATPNQFYKIATFKINGEQVEYQESEGKYVFEILVLNDVQVEVTFEVIKFNVLHTVSENGTVTVSNTLTNGLVNGGNSVRFTIRTTKGYKAVVTDNGVKTVIGTKTLQNAYNTIESSYYTLSSVDCDHEIYIEFVKIHKISIGSFNPDHVSITINGEPIAYVLNGEEIEVELEPKSYKNDQYYEIKSLLVGDVEWKTYLIDNKAKVKVYEDCAINVEMQEATVKYSLIIQQSENGIVEYEGNTSLSKGDIITMLVIPDEHCSLETFSVNGVIVNGFSGGQYTLTMPESNVEIVAKFKKNVYTVSLPSVSNGTIETSATYGNYGDEITIDLDAFEHYELAVFTVNGEDKLSKIIDGKYTFTLEQNVVIQVSFAKKVYNISLTQPYNGKAVLTKESGNYGDIITVEITCEPNYETKELVINGVNKVSEIRNGKYTFVLEGDTLVEIVNDKIRYKVTINPTTNGMVIADKTEVEIGQTVNFTITPYGYYQLKTFTINGEDKLADVEEGTLALVVNQNILVNATFSLATYTITSSYDSTKGFVSFSKTEAQYNTNVAISVQAKTGYKISNIYINGKEVEITNTSNWNNSAYTVTADTFVEVVFDEMGICYFTMPVSIENATVTISDGPYKINQVVNFTIVLRDNYAIKYFKINGVDVSSAITSRGTLAYTPTDEEVSNYVVEVATEIRHYSIAMTQTDGGSATLGSNSAIYSDKVTITTVPNAGYHLRGAEIKGANYILDGNNLVLLDFTADVTVNVIFGQDAEITTYTGKVMYEDGLAVKGVQVLVTGNGVNTNVVTDENGEYSIDLTPEVYTFKIANSNGMISSSSTTTASKFNVYDVENIILTTRKVGVDIAGQYFTYENANITYSYDSTTKSDKVVVTDSSVSETYFDGMLTDEGVVFFSVKNTTDTGISNYQNDPGIGITLINEYFKIDCLLGAQNVSIYLPDGSLSAYHYVQNQSNISYNLNSNGGGAKYYFALAKRGNTIYFLTSEDGKYDYQIVSSYENDNLNGAFAWSLCVFAEMGSYSTAQIEFNDFRITSNIDSIRHVLESCEFESITSENGSITLGENVNMNGTTYRKVIIAPFENYVLTELTVNGTNVEFEKIESGIYNAYVPVNNKVNLVATYGSQETKIEYSTGLENDMTLTYDTSLFRRNDKTVSGADPGVMWVDPKDDPVYGGYFYVAVTSGGSTQTPGNVSGAYRLFRSKDLASWERAGMAKNQNGNILNGMSLELPYESWVYTNLWAPELTYETYVGTDGEKHTRYYIYFSASARDYTAGNNVTMSVDKWSTLYLGIGVADAPTGPYRLVETSNYYQFYDKLDLTNLENREHINFYQGISNLSQRTTNLLDENITAMDPPINFYKNNSELRSEIDKHAQSKGLANGYWPAIDVSPFKDPATGELYMLFSQHTTEKLTQGNTIWIMKMKDYITPDYSTMHIVAMPGYTINVTDFKSYFRDDSTNYRYTSDCRNGRISRFTYDGTQYGGGVNEGAHGIAHYDENTNQWLYYLTYSPFGYGDRGYSVLQAVAISPMGPYIKIDPTKGISCNGMINFNNNQGSSSWVSGTTGNGNLDYTQSKDLSASIDYMAGCGHHSFVQAGDETFIMYHSFSNPIDNHYASGAMIDRCLSVDKVSFQTSPVVKYGDIKSTNNANSYIPLIYGSGPTYSLQPLPEIASGYGNVADKATLTVTGGDSTKKYLTDDIHVMHSVYKDWEYQVDRSATLTFDYSSNPQNMRAIMVYNSAQYAYALKSIDSIVLTLVDGREMTFTNVTNTEENAFDDKKVMRFGGSAILSFEELYVSKVVINVSTSGKYDKSNTTIRIGDVKILARLPGVKASEVSTKATIGNSLLSSSDGGAILDGKFDDAIYQNKKVYYEDMGDFGITVTVAMSKEGFYVGTIVKDKHLYSAGNNGETLTKYHGINRWDKNTYMKIGAYVGSKYDFTANSTAFINVSPYSIQGEHDIISEVNVNGEINSGKSKSFATETYFPYSLFNKQDSDVEEVRVFVSYQRPLSTKDKNPQTYNVNGSSIGYLEGYLTFNKEGYVVSGINNFGSSMFGDVAVGAWRENNSVYVNDSLVEGVIYDANAIGDNSSYTIKISNSILNKNGYSGIAVASNCGTRVFALDYDAKTLNLYSFSLDGNKELVYSNSFYVVSNGFATLTVVRVGNVMNVLIDGNYVHSETDTTLSGKVNYGLYAYGDKISLVNPAYSEKISGYSSINTAYAVSDNYSNVRITSNGSQIKIYPTLGIGGRVISSVNVNGTSYTTGLYGLTLPISSDVIVCVTTAPAGTSYTVSGKFTDKGVDSTGSVEFVSSDKNNVYVCPQSSTYSISLPAGTYTVNAKKDFRKVSSKTLTISRSTTYNPALYNVFEKSVTINGTVMNSTTQLAFGKDGMSFSMEDRQVGVTTYLATGMVDNIVIDYTTENFADATFYDSGKYEKDITLGIEIINAQGRSVIGFAGGRMRILPSGTWDSTMIDGSINNPVLLVNNPIENYSKGVSEPGGNFKIRFIKYNDVAYLYAYNPSIESTYKFIYAYDLQNCKNSGKGACYYSIFSGTTKEYNKIRILDVSYETNDSTVLSTLNSMPQA